MNDINIFNDPTKVPKPKGQIKVETLRATPYPDGYRIRAEIGVTPFLERPNLLLVLKNASGEVVHELNVIESMHYDMEFTFHLRGIDDPRGEYTLEVELFYENRNPPQDTRSISFVISLDDE